MAQTNSTKRNLRVHELEMRTLPAGALWPFPGGPAQSPLLETWGQYQELTEKQIGAAVPYDDAVHLHDGIDILPTTQQGTGAGVGTKVYPVMDGEILDFRADGWSSYVVIGDLTGGKK